MPGRPRNLQRRNWGFDLLNYRWDTTYAASEQRRRRDRRKGRQLNRRTLVQLVACSNPDANWPRAFVANPTSKSSLGLAQMATGFAWRSWIRPLEPSSLRLVSPQRTAPCCFAAHSLSRSCPHLCVGCERPLHPFGLPPRARVPLVEHCPSLLPLITALPSR